MSVMFGALTPTATASLSVPDEFTVTELLPVTFAPSATVDPTTVLAVKVTSKPVTNPAVARLPPVALRMNVLPAVVPELLALRVTVPALLSVILTKPLVLALSALVDTEPAVILPAPDVKLIVPAVRVPAD